jgi:outer membrane lipoprotein carrier protein
MRGLILMAAVLAASFPAAAEDSANAAAGYGLIREFTTGLEALRARFRQTLLDASGKVTEEAAGTLTLMRPDRFRWDYETPYEQLVLGDGKRLWSYDADLEQAVVRDYDEVLAASPAMLLSGSGDVEALYEVEDLKVEAGQEWVLLSPRIADTDFRALALTFEDGKLIRMELVDNLDQLTRIDFVEVERNPPLPEDAFVFRPPEGVDVIGAGEG